MSKLGVSLVQHPGYDLHIDSQGKATPEGMQALRDIHQAITAVLGGHNDNTNASCRGDLDGHDCCFLCNIAGDALRGAVDGGNLE